MHISHAQHVYGHVFTPENDMHFLAGLYTFVYVACTCVVLDTSHVHMSRAFTEGHMSRAACMILT